LNNSEQSAKRRESWRRGWVLTPAFSLSPHVFKDIEETRMDTDDFYDLACFNLFHHFNRLGSISGSNRHQRHQAACRA
jgi:hypothetical protein